MKERYQPNLKNIAIRSIREINEKYLSSRKKIKYEDFLEEFYKRLKRGEIHKKNINIRDIERIIYDLVKSKLNKKRRRDINNIVSGTIRDSILKEKDREEIKKIIFESETPEEISKNIEHFINKINQEEYKRRGYTNLSELKEELSQLRNLFLKKKQITYDFYTDLWKMLLEGKKSDEEIAKLLSEKYTSLRPIISSIEEFEEENIEESIKREVKRYRKIMDVIKEISKYIEEKVEEENPEKIQNTVKKKFRIYSYLFTDFLGEKKFEETIKRIFESIYKKEKFTIDFIEEIVRRTVKKGGKDPCKNEKILKHIEKIIEDRGLKKDLILYPIFPFDINKRLIEFLPTEDPISICKKIFKKGKDQKGTMENIKKCLERNLNTLECKTFLFVLKKIDELKELPEDLKEIIPIVKKLNSIKAKAILIDKLSKASIPTSSKKLLIGLEKNLIYYLKMLKEAPLSEIRDIHEKYVYYKTAKKISFKKLYTIEERLRLIKEIIKITKQEKNKEILKKLAQEMLEKEKEEEEFVEREYKKIAEKLISTKTEIIEKDIITGDPDLDIKIEGIGSFTKTEEILTYIKTKFLQIEKNYDNQQFIMEAFRNFLRNEILHKLEKDYEKKIEILVETFFIFFIPKSPIVGELKKIEKREENHLGLSSTITYIQCFSSIKGSRKAIEVARGKQFFKKEDIELAEKKYTKNIKKLYSSLKRVLTKKESQENFYDIMLKDIYEKIKTKKEDNKIFLIPIELIIEIKKSLNQKEDIEKLKEIITQEELEAKNLMDLREPYKNSLYNFFKKLYEEERENTKGRFIRLFLQTLSQN